MGPWDADDGPDRRHGDLVHDLLGSLAGMATGAAMRLPSSAEWEVGVLGEDVDDRDHARVSHALRELLRTTEAAFRARDGWDHARSGPRAEELEGLESNGLPAIPTAIVGGDGDPESVPVAVMLSAGAKAT
jgi:hypothetical protein